MLLKEIDENNKVFLRNGKHYYPGLKNTIKVLFHENFKNQFTESERMLFKLFKKLEAPRNKIMHGEMPEEMDVSIMAMTLIGMSRISQQKCGESIDQIVEQSPTIQKDVIDSIRATKLGEYSDFIEAFVKESNEDIFIEQCPYCGTQAVVEHKCEACFEDLEERECSHCGEQNLVVRGIPIPETCAFCEEKLPS